MYEYNTHKDVAFTQKHLNHTCARPRILVCNLPKSRLLCYYRRFSSPRISTFTSTLWLFHHTTLFTAYTHRRRHTPLHIIKHISTRRKTSARDVYTLAQTAIPFAAYSYHLCRRQHFPRACCCARG